MRVLIVGGGFGGVKAALNLSKNSQVEVTLISDRDCFEYHAALYRSATGRSRHEVAIPLRDIFASHPRIKLAQAHVEKIDLAQKSVSDRNGRVYHYDSLILALGSTTAYFGIKGLKEFSYGIKSIDEALHFRAHLHKMMTSPNIPDRNYIVVGAGPTGIELAGELVAYIRQVMRRHHIRKSIKVILVEAAPRILPNMSTDVARKIARRLRKLGVKIYTGTAVMGESADSLRLPEGSVETHSVVWTAGVTNNSLFEKVPDFILEKGKKVKVDEFLQAAPGVYVIGDSAETPFSGMAQTAMHDADFVSSNLLAGLRNRPPRAYKPQKPAYAFPVGPHWAVVIWHGLQFSSFVGWWLRRLADLRLFLTLMPPWQGVMIWRAGNQVEETCPVCKKAAAK